MHHVLLLAGRPLEHPLRNTKYPLHAYGGRSLIFVLKWQVIQLYEMIVVRHGLMLVGPTGGGKSSNLHVLEETLSQLKQMGKEVKYVHRGK